MRGTVIMVAVLLAGMVAAVAEVYEETVTHINPVTGAECTITFRAPMDTAVSRADVTNIRAAFENAMANSNDMVNKVEDACSKHMNMLEVVLFRDSFPVDVYIGETFGNGIIAMDPGDIEDMIKDMVGSVADKQKVVNNQLIAVLAHEIDHNRHTATENHRDPTPAELIFGKRGLAVDDENLVLSQLNTMIVRKNYARWDLVNGTTVVDFTVSGRPVVFNLTQNMAAREALSRFASPTVFTLGPSLVLSIPFEPCIPGSSPDCFPPPGAVDVDHDGVPDSIDNCIDLPNPQQSDHDGDGQGSGCDPDDDSDDTCRSVEIATGSSDNDATAKPEHWSCAGEPFVCGSAIVPCADGMDNDLDGLVDLDDPGCIVPFPVSLGFPVRTPPGETVPIYHGVGGVPEKQDALLVSATVRFDHDFNGTTDSVQTALGVAVVRHDPPFFGDMQGSLLELSLQGFDPTLGDFELRTVHGPTNPFLLTAKQTGSDFPATGRIDYTIELETSGFGQLGQVVAGLQSSFVPTWPPHETIWNSFGPPMIFSPAGGGAPVTEIVSMTVRYERDTDFDGTFDPQDNCPTDANPGQANSDGDSAGDACDCDSTDGTVWSAPADLKLFFLDLTTLLLSPEGPPGAQIEVVDVISSTSPDDFVNGATCIASDLFGGFVGDFVDTPLVDRVIFLVGRGQNGCPLVGQGDAGREVRDCP